MPPWMSSSPLRTISRMGALNFRKKFMDWKTLTLTACATSCSGAAPGPSSSLAVLATEAKPCSRPSKAQPGALDSLAWKVCVAPAMAPHCVCPKTRISRVPSLPVQNSRLPTMLPSAWVQVFPALRSTKMSPGMASNTVSRGARESAHPMMAVWGAWPSLTRARRMSGVTLPEMPAPTTKRSLPTFNSFSAAWGAMGPSEVVRTVPKAMDGGSVPSAASSSACWGERPKNSTRPVSRW
mmetsp:Transcript_42783/g.101975  ORF Transcript_42783/g.101975 Transcript_42783/m.101975 type:complete len:238 (-) Transcript_42783:507-1220(-)